MHLLFIAIFLVLSLGTKGYAKETISDSSSNLDTSKDVSSGLSRAKRGNFRRWNRGLQMLRLGKRDGADVFDDDVESEKDIDDKPYYFQRDLYSLVDDTLAPHIDLGDSTTDDFSKRSLAMLRLGKRVPNIGDLDDDNVYDKRTLNMLRLGKRQLEMLRLGKRGDDNDADERSLAQLRLSKRLSDLSDEGTDGSLAQLRLSKRLSDLSDDGAEGEDGSSYEKRKLNMLRLGKRHMQMLRLGKRADDIDTDGTLGQLRLGDMYAKRSLSRLRLGKRHMQMLRLGKRKLRLGGMYKDVKQSGNEGNTDSV